MSIYPRRIWSSSSNRLHHHTHHISRLSKNTYIETTHNVFSHSRSVVSPPDGQPFQPSLPCGAIPQADGPRSPVPSHPSSVICNPHTPKPPFHSAFSSLIISSPFPRRQRLPQGISQKRLDRSLHRNRTRNHAGTCQATGTHRDGRGDRQGEARASPPGGLGDRAILHSSWRWPLSVAVMRCLAPVMHCLAPVLQHLAPVTHAMPP